MGNTAGASAAEYNEANFPKSDTTHFVLGTPLRIDQDEKLAARLQTAVFGTGCFWGSEKRLWRMPGVFTTAVGYTAGTVVNPTYEAVCSGETMHAEVVFVAWDPEVVTFSDLVRMHFESHNPTSGNGQGNDIGTQYRSGIYYTSEPQRLIAEAARDTYQAALKAEGATKAKITTEILPLKKFYYAESYHQQYLARPGSRPYCSAEPLGVSMPDFSTWGDAVLKSLSKEEAALVGPPKLPAKFWEKHGPKPYCSITKEKDSQIELSSL